MDAMLHFMAFIFAAEIVARFIGDGVLLALPDGVSLVGQFCLLSARTQLTFTCVPTGPRVYVRSNAELADAAVVALSLAGVFLQSIPNINILRILRCHLSNPFRERLCAMPLICCIGLTTRCLMMPTCVDTQM